jgi:hypothetical protein
MPQPRTYALADEIVALNLDIANMDLINRVSGWGLEEWSQVDGDAVKAADRAEVVIILARIAQDQLLD